MKKLLILLTVITISLSLTACNGGEDDDINVIYVTVYPMQFLIEEIVGDTVEVKKVPGTSSHGDAIDWSAKEIIDMLDADLLFYINGGADSYIPNNASTFEDGNVQLVDMSQHITYNLVCYEHDHETEDPAGTEPAATCDENSLNEDPHFWLDPVRMIQAAEFVKDKLIAHFPENQELYNNEYALLSAALGQLDQDYQTMADAATKPIITTVMLFTYYEVRYGLEIEAITADAHSSESNPGDIIEFVEHAIEEEIIYILFEKNANSPAGDQVLEELRSTVLEADALYLHGLGNLTMEENENGSNYISIMYDNLEALKLATK